MKRGLTLLVCMVLCLCAVTATAEVTYPVLSETPMAYAVDEHVITVGEKTLYGKLYLPEGEGSFPTVILCHGMNNNETTNDYAAHTLAACGFACYTFAFCGGSMDSRSSGKITDMSVLTEKADLEDVLAHVRQQSFCDPGRIILMGSSQGGLVATLVAADHAQEIAALMLYFPAYTIPANARATYASVDEIPKIVRFDGAPLGKVYYADIYDLYIEDVLPSYTGPVHIVHGDADTMVPLASSEAAVELFPNATLTVLPGEGHQLTEAGKCQAITAAYAFLKPLLP